MSETRPLQSAQPSPGANARAPEQRSLPTDTIARFRQALSEPERGNSKAATLASSDSSDSGSSTAASSERRESSSMMPGVPATVGSLYYTMPFSQATAEPAMAPDTAEAARLIEQATSILMERASRTDATRFIVSLDHAIVGGASAEFVRDGAFLFVRLLARTDAAYRSMWTHRAQLGERLAASTGLVTRVEILEGYGDGRSA